MSNRPDWASWFIAAVLVLALRGVVRSCVAGLIIDPMVKVDWQLRTGDKAIIVGALSIAAYERFVRNDADLISSRVAVYKKRFPLLTTGVVLVTAFHLLEWLRPEYDVYSIAVRWVRPAPPPDPRRHPYQ